MAYYLALSRRSSASNTARQEFACCAEIIQTLSYARLLYDDYDIDQCKLYKYMLMARASPNHTGPALLLGFGFLIRTTLASPYATSARTG